MLYKSCIIVYSEDYCKEIFDVKTSNKKLVSKKN